MALVTIREIEEGEDLVIATVNDTLSDWVTETASVGASNIREEGLHHRVLEDGAVMEQSRDTSTGTAITVNGGSAAAVLNDGSSDMVIGPFAFSTTNDETIIVRASFHYEMATDDTEFTATIRYGSSSSGPWTTMNRSSRTLGMRVGAGFPVGKGSLTIAAHYDGATNATLYFALFAVSGPTGADDTTVDSVTFFAENVAR
jgi:hypothetical protein